ncbi:MAG TPA: hypothetical protein VNI54_05300 [Thermoanaerobaculia bacterium]|nr:hypothetical protein [Thermoanaerobaculia bacterium]
MRKTIVVALLSCCFAAIAYADCNTFTLLTESVPLFRVDQPAHFQIEAIGGDGPYHFEIYDGVLPEGLHLTSRGRIIGRPTENAVTFGDTVFIRVTDSQGCSLVHAYNFAVE